MDVFGRQSGRNIVKVVGIAKKSEISTTFNSSIIYNWMYKLMFLVLLTKIICFITNKFS